MATFTPSWMVLLLAFIATATRCASIPEPSNVHVQNIWPGQVQVMWSYNGSSNTSFRVSYGVKGGSSSVTYRTSPLKSHVSVLSGLQGKSTYLVRVTAHLGGQVARSATMSVKVGEGVPWRPNNLTATVNMELNVTRLSWIQAGQNEVNHYIVLLTIYNNSRVVGKPTSMWFDLTDDNLTDYTVQVWAVNDVGKGEASVLHVGAGESNVYRDTTPVQLPEKPSNGANMILVIVFSVAVAAGALFVVAMVFSYRRRRHLSAMDRSSGSEVLFYMPLRQKRHDTEDDSLGESYTVSFRNNTDHTASRNSMYSTSDSRHKVSPSKLPYTPPSEKPHYRRAPDVSPYEIGPVRHAYGRAASQRDSNRLSSLSSTPTDSPRSKRIPIIPLSSEKLYSNVNIQLDRYLIHPERLSDSERSVRFSWDSQDRLSHIYSTVEDGR